MPTPWRVDQLVDGTSYSSSCTLLSNDGHRVVVDTGLSLQEGVLVDALHAKGLEPADIDVVINTHLHLDHCGNNAIFTRALIAMSQADWRWTSAFYQALFASRTPELEAPRFYPEIASYAFKPRTVRNVARLARLFWNAARVGAEDRFRWLEAWDLPAGLEVVPTPGHTPHHVSIRVAASPPVLVAGDAVLAENADAKVRTMIPHSRVQFLETRQALLRAGETIVPGHGPQFTPQPAGERA